MFNLDEGQTSLKTLATDMYDSLNKINSLENITIVQEHLNLQKVGMTHCSLALNASIGGQTRSDYYKHKENKYLTEDQVDMYTKR